MSGYVQMKECLWTTCLWHDDKIYTCTSSLLGAPGLLASLLGTRTLQGAPGLTTRSKDATTNDAVPDDDKGMQRVPEDHSSVCLRRLAHAKRNATTLTPERGKLDLRLPLSDYCIACFVVSDGQSLMGVGQRFLTGITG